MVVAAVGSEGGFSAAGFELIVATEEHSEIAQDSELAEVAIELGL